MFFNYKLIFCFIFFLYATGEICKFMEGGSNLICQNMQIALTIMDFWRDIAYQIFTILMLCEKVDKWYKIILVGDWIKQVVDPGDEILDKVVEIHL